jgi:hypothetical protein
MADAHSGFAVKAFQGQRVVVVVVVGHMLLLHRQYNDKNFSNGR